MLNLLHALSLMAMLIALAACQTPSQPTPRPHPAANLVPISEDFLDELYRASKPFADFYDTEIAPMNATIRWFHHPNLPPGTTAYVHMNDDGSTDICLGKISADEDVAIIIAHELAALVTASRGYQPLQYNDETPYSREVSDALYDMVSSPLRDSTLADYGFDVEKEFTYKISSIFSVSCVEPSDPMVIHENACGYALMILYWQNVLGNHGVPLNIDNWYKECFPNSREEGRNILAIVDEIGYDTWEKATTLFQRIIHEYDLEHCIRVP